MDELSRLKLKDLVSEYKPEETTENKTIKTQL